MPEKTNKTPIKISTKYLDFQVDQKHWTHLFSEN